MALATAVTKSSVSRIMDSLWNITLNMTLTDDAAEVLNKDYSARYRPGDSIEAKEDQFVEMMQADIDKYKSEQTIYNAAALDTAVVNVGNDLVV